MASKKDLRREKIKKSIRSKISGTDQRPRLTVFKSNTTLYAQLIDDLKGHTLASCSSKELGLKNSNIESAKEVGKKIAEKAITAGISSVVFDRNGYLYHGKIKSLADAARETGLKF